MLGRLDRDLLVVLEELLPEEKEEIAKALRYNSLQEIKDKHEDQDNARALEWEIRYAGSHWL